MSYLEAFFGKMSWPNQGILHPISSILTYYGPQTNIPIKSYTRFKFKKKFRKKKHFVITNDRTRHVDRVSPSPLASSTSCCHVSNSPTPLASSLQKQIPSEKNLETTPFKNKFLKETCFDQFAAFVYHRTKLGCTRVL